MCATLETSHSMKKPMQPTEDRDGKEFWYIQSSKEVEARILRVKFNDFQFKEQPMFGRIFGPDVQVLSHESKIKNAGDELRKRIERQTLGNYTLPEPEPTQHHAKSSGKTSHRESSDGFIDDLTDGGENWDGNESVVMKKLLSQNKMSDEKVALFTDLPKQLELSEIFGRHSISYSTRFSTAWPNNRKERSVERKNRN